MIEIRDLTKRFGDFTAVDHLDLTIETGEFFGLLGPNGAGKTTTISMMSTVLLPSEGEVRIDGQVLDRKASEQKSKLSVITQEYSMPCPRIEHTFHSGVCLPQRLFPNPSSN